MHRSLLVRGAACLALVVSVTLWLDGGIAVNSASSAFPTGKITITVFGSDEEPQFQLEENLIGEWQKLHPNVTVQAQQAPLGPAFQKLSTQLPTGGGPTIFSVFEPWIEGFSPYMAPANPAAFGVARHDGRFSRFAALEHPFPGVQQQIAFEFFCRSAVTLVTMLDEHRPDVLLEEIVILGLELRRGHQGSGRKRNNDEYQSQAKLQFRTRHNRNFSKLWPRQ